MNARLATLKRIKNLYEKVEESHSLTLRQATANVRQTEREIREQCDQIANAANEASHALTERNREQWVLAGVQRRFSTIRRQQLESVKDQRKLVMEQAKEEYEANHIKTEQMKSLVAGKEVLIQMTTDRKAQAAMDDRFLSRLHPKISSFDKF